MGGSSDMASSYTPKKSSYSPGSMIDVELSSGVIGSVVLVEIFRDGILKGEVGIFEVEAPVVPPAATSINLANSRCWEVKTSSYKASDVNLEASN